MEVTCSNFKETLASVGETINKATFLTIDCEFSGLNLASEINAFDTPKQYYEKVRKNSKDFLVLQYGITAFRFDEGINGFKQQSYNFFIFRRPINNNIPDQRFLCQTSSINFLINQGFDFNKLFKLGISYLNIFEETNCRDKLEERQKTKNNQNSPQHTDIVQIPDDMKPTIDDVMRQIADFLDSDNEELELPKSNAFMRRLIYQTVGQKYKNKVVLETKVLKNKDRILVASKFKSKEEQEEKNQKMFEQELAVLDDFIGFTKVLRLIIDAGKLIIGHNMCLDFFHTIDKFLTPLPEDYQEFKDCAHALFKNILDTKFMASSDDFNDLIQCTVLKDVLDTVSKDPFTRPAIEIEDGGQGYSLEHPKEHEAGYDAYITGVCFLSMWNYLGKLKELSVNDTFKDFNLLTPYLNKIYLMVLRDNQFIHLGGADSNPSRDHVFYLTFPKEWKLNNIIELFSPFGSVYVAWIDETSAFVGLYNRDQAYFALSSLSKGDTYKIMSYSRRVAQLSGGKTLFSSPMPIAHRKRPIENSSKSNKNQKTDHPVRKLARRFQPIMEDAESEDGGSPIKISKIDTNKTFMESDAWD